MPLSAQCSCPSSPYGSDQVVHGQRGSPFVVFVCSTLILLEPRLHFFQRECLSSLVLDSESGPLPSESTGGFQGLARILSISQSSSETCKSISTCSTPNPVSLTQEMLYSTYRVWFCETQMTGWERRETLLPRGISNKKKIGDRRGNESMQKMKVW